MVKAETTGILGFMGTRGPAKQFAAVKLVKLTAEQLAEIQAYRDAHKLASDSEAIRALIRAGLDAKPKRSR